MVTLSRQLHETSSVARGNTRELPLLRKRAVYGYLLGIIYITVYVQWLGNSLAY